MAAARRSSPRAEPAARRQSPSTDAGRVSQAVREAITISEIVSVGVLNLVRSTLVAAISGVRDVGAEVGVAATMAVRGSIRAAADVGGDLGTVAKQAIKGIVEATQEVGGDLGMAARAAARGAVKTADEVGGDVAKVAGKAVEGVIEAAREIGADVGDLARSAVEGAIEAADNIGSAAGRAVRSTVSKAVKGAARSRGPNPRNRPAPLVRRGGPLVSPAGRHRDRRAGLPAAAAAEGPAAGPRRCPEGL